MATETIDLAAVEQFVAGAQGATAEQIATVATRMETMIRRGERAKGQAGFVSLATMAEIARRLRELTAPPVAKTPAPTVAPVNETASVPTGHIRFAVRLPGGSKSAFASAVARAKHMGGRYDAETKTWLLTERVVELNGGVERLSGLGLHVIGGN